MDRIKLIVAEEQEIFRQAYSVVLASEPDVEVVGVVESGEEVLAMIPHLNPQVVLLGNNAPSHTFVEEVRRIRAQHPGVGLVLCSGSDDPECIRELFAGNSLATPNSGAPLGGWGYLLKQDVDTVAELMRVIHAVAEGRIVLDSAVAERLSHQPPHSAEFIHERFTQREMEVLSLMSEGLKNVPIARVLCLEVKTVEHHINNIFAKLGFSTDAEHHARVQAVLTYFRAIGALQDESALASHSLLPGEALNVGELGRAKHRPIYASRRT